jgi:DNA-binding transcriptional LysR family regulator
MPLNLHFLRVFYAVASSGSFTQAAKTLFLTQSAVSRGVQELEQQVGIPLLDRAGHKVSLTQTGKILYEHAAQIFAIERAAEIALEQAKGLDRGYLAIGASHTIGTYLLPPLLGKFHRRYPDVRLTMEIGNTYQIVWGLRTTPYDVAFVESTVAAPDLVGTPWRIDKLVVIAAANHPLDKQDRVSLDQLLNEPFIHREPQSGTRAVVDAALQATGAQLRVAMELGGTQAVKEAVSAGLGVAIVSEAALSLELTASTLSILNVPELILERTLAHVRVEGRSSSPALKALLSLIMEQSA